jgi:hypothetical protein
MPHSVVLVHETPRASGATHRLETHISAPTQSLELEQLCAVERRSPQAEFTHQSAPSHSESLRQEVPRPPADSQTPQVALELETTQFMLEHWPLE